MKAADPVGEIVKQTRDLLEQSSNDLKKYRRGLDSVRETLKRSHRLAEDCMPVRAMRYALISK